MWESACGTVFTNVLLFLLNTTFDLIHMTMSLTSNKNGNTSCLKKMKNFFTE
jgi:hypothetical protein